MFLSCRLIPLAAIAFSNDWNLHPWELDEIPPELKTSFENIGVLHPPIVREVEGDLYTIINGYKRLQFLKTIPGQEEVCCMIVDPKARHSYSLDLLLTDCNSGAGLSLAEKARFLQLASTFLSEKEISEKYLHQLGLKKNPAIIRTLTKIVEQDITIVREVHANRVGEKMVTELLNLPEESDRTELVQLFRDLGMGDSKQKRFFTLLRDNAFRRGYTISEYLATEQIQAVLHHEQLNVPQKIHHLSTYLQQQLTPSLIRAEEDFHQQLSSLHLPPNYTITHSPSFEKNEVTLSINFSSLDDCKAYLTQKAESSITGP